jgi:hypothetical protein
VNYRHQLHAFCDGCRFLRPRCLRVHPNRRRQEDGRRYGDFAPETVVLCEHCREDPRWARKYKVCQEHR